MTLKKIKGYRLKAMRTALGWTQEDFALVLKISRAQYAKIESNIRGTDAALAERIKLIQDSVNHLKSQKLLTRYANPIWPQAVYDALQLREGELSIQINDMERWLRGRRKNTLRKYGRNELLAAQLNYLSEANAPKYMLQAFSLLVQDENKAEGYHTLENVYLYEATLAGKKAELSYLRKKLASRTKTKKKK